jgi:hypothetical protein
MRLRRKVLALLLAIVLIVGWALLLPRQTVVPSLAATNKIARVEAPRPEPEKPSRIPRAPGVAESLSSLGLELNRLEGEFYHKFPLALKYRDYQDRSALSEKMRAISERFKDYMEEPKDVPTRNLRSGNLNTILQVEATAWKGMLGSGSDLGEMMRVGFKAKQWDWPHMFRNLDSSIGGDFGPPPVVENVEQLVAAIEIRENRINDYCRKKQEEASMPDSVREDIGELGLMMFTQGVVKAYLETITPPELREARKRLTREEREKGRR